MNEREEYIKILNNAKAENRKKGLGVYYEEHHILPKALFPNWKKRKMNLILLTAGEHLKVHLLLAKIYGGCMWYACFKLAKTNKGTLLYNEYEELRLNNSKYQSERMKGNNFGSLRNISEEYKQKMRELRPIGSWTPTEDSKRKNSESCKLKWADPEYYKRMLDIRKNQAKKYPNLGGYKYFNNGIKTIQALECPEGFVPGNLTGNKNKKWWTNGKENIMSKECPKNFWRGLTKRRKV